MIPSKMIDLSKIHTYPLQERKNKVRITDFARPPKAGQSMSDWLAALPNILAASTLIHVAKAIARAHKQERSVAFAVGAHVIKCGLSPIIIDLMKQGIITSVALNGGGSIHDFELALIGETSEDVQEGLVNGRFGMAEETGRFMNEALLEARERDGVDFSQGMGMLLGRKLIELAPPYRAYSILVAGVELDVPVTVHVAIGTDIIHMHPAAHGGNIGQASFNDFRRYTAALLNLGHGGVYLNVGSAVLLPEVFLKALTVLHNLGHDVFDFVTVNMDMQQHYRPLENVVRRPTTDQGKGYTLTGRHELMVPLLAQAIIEELTLPE